MTKWTVSVGWQSQAIGQGNEQIPGRQTTFTPS